MDGSGSVNNEETFLLTRIQQLEHERDELRKDIEQMCLQQAGPSYLVIATRMHFQRTAGLEQEIETLKKKLALCTRDNLNLQEELSEVYRIKSQMAALYDDEVSKNVEAEKQLKFFQGCVAAAFAERDYSFMEAEMAKEKEEAISLKFNDLQKRFEELESNDFREKKLQSSLQIDLMKLQKENVAFEKVITKFYSIRQRCLGLSDNVFIDEKCEYLLNDAREVWTFGNESEMPTSQYINALETELEKLRRSVDNVQNKLRVGLEIEDHLRKNIHQLKEEKIFKDDLIKRKMSEFHDIYNIQRIEVISILQQMEKELKLNFDVVEAKMKKLYVNETEKFESIPTENNFEDIECRDVHITADASSTLGPEVIGYASVDDLADTSQVLDQALHEKVDALLLLSQEEERYLMKRNVNTAVQEKMEELQRNLLQVTNEKVNALMELAQLEQKYQELKENAIHGAQPHNIIDKSIGVHEREGRLKNLWSKMYLRRWIPRQDLSEDCSDGQMSRDEGNSTNTKLTYSTDYARMKIENATLQESRENVKHLTAAMHKMRISLLKAVREATTLEGSGSSTVTKSFDDIITEINILKIALGSSLPVSWSADAKPDGSAKSQELCGGKLDFVSAIGFEMVELLMFAAQILKENMMQKSTG